MNDILKKWFIPSGFMDLWINRHNIISKRLPENGILKDKYKDINRCFILATGPSISSENLMLLKGEFCISVSNFFVHPLYNIINPNFQVFATSHPPITPKMFESWINEAMSCSSENTTFIISNEDKRTEYGKQYNKQVFYYNNGGKLPVNFTKKLPPAQTVVHVAIYLAIYLGIKNIYLLGVDHDWILHYGESVHFYEENEHELVRSGYNEYFNKDIGSEFHSYATLWDIYRSIRVYAEKENIKIINCCMNSLLDIFPKKSLDSLFETN